MKFKSILTVMMMVFILKTNITNANNPTESVTKSVQPFRILTVQDDLQVIIREGTVESVTIEGDSKKINTIKLTQQGDQLVLSKKGITSKSGNVVVYVTVSDLRIIEVTGDARIQSSGKLGGDLLWVKLAGDGEVDLETTARKVLTTSWSNGKILIHGNYQSCSTYKSESGRPITAYSKNGAASSDNPEN